MRVFFYNKLCITNGSSQFRTRQCYDQNICSNRPHCGWPVSQLSISISSLIVSIRLCTVLLELQKAWNNRASSKLERRSYRDCIRPLHATKSKNRRTVSFDYLHPSHPSPRRYNDPTLSSANWYGTYEADVKHAPDNYENNKHTSQDINKKSITR